MERTAIQISHLTKMLGAPVGSGLRFAGSMTNFGLGGVVAGVGEDVANARARGVIGAALDKVAKQSLGKNVAANMIGGVAGRVGGGMAIANVAKFTPSKAGMLVKASELFADVAVSEGLMSLADRDVGMLSGKRKGQ